MEEITDVKRRFKTLSDKEKETILSKIKSENTNASTKMWINCLCDYLIENTSPFPEIEDLDNMQLAEVRQIDIQTNE